ncbi:MAG: GNAT family N-acetyltransferase [Myxococcota bacterium]
MIRPATIADLEAIVAANISMAAETENVTLDPQKITPGVAALLEGKATGHYYVGTVDEHVVAQTMITFEFSDWRNADVWWIQSVYVTPEHRRQGWYRRLYEYVQKEAKEAGAAGIRLYVDKRNISAQAVYTRLGMDAEHYQMFEAMFD